MSRLFMPLTTVARWVLEISKLTLVALLVATARRGGGAAPFNPDAAKVVCRLPRVTSV